MTDSLPKIKRVALRQAAAVRRSPQALAPHELVAVDAFLDSAKRQAAMRRALANKAAPRPISLAPCAFLTRPDPDDDWTPWPPSEDRS
jgi:hypothetical protein